MSQENLAKDFVLIESSLKELKIEEDNLTRLYSACPEKKTAININEWHHLHKAVQTFDEFTHNLETRYSCPQLKLSELPWRSDQNQLHSDYLLAGGSVLNCVHSANDFQSAYLTSDLDFFVLGADEDTQRKNAKRLLEHLSLVANGSCKPEVTATDSSVSFFGWVSSFFTFKSAAKVSESQSSAIWFANKGSVIQVWMKGMSRVIQVILLPQAKTYNDILGNFDHSCCGFGYDGKAVWATSGAVESIKTGINVYFPDLYRYLARYNADKSPTTFYLRLDKMQARGFQNVCAKGQKVEFSTSTTQTQRKTAAESNQSNVWPVFDASSINDKIALLKKLGYTNPSTDFNQVNVCQFKTHRSKASSSSQK